MSATASVVVGWDGSPGSRAALTWGARAAQLLGASLTAVYVDLVTEAAFITSYTAEPAPMRQDHVDDVLAAARNLAESVAPGLNVETMQREGHPVSVLTDLSAEADLLVVGSRGRSRLSAMLIGSTSVAVASHARCPVVVIRDEEPPSADAPVVVGTDGSASSADAIRFAVRYADAVGAPLRVVGAVPEASAVLAGENLIPAQYLAEAREEATAFVYEALGGIREDYPDLEVAVTISHRPPGAALAEAAETARLLVVGTRGRGGFVGMLLGSVSRSVLFSAHCPVAIVRPEEKAHS